MKRMAQRIEDEDYHPLGEHVVEIPARHHAASSAPKRSFAALGVAAFVALASITVVVGIAQERAAEKRDERARQDQLSEGWQTLSSIAAEGAANDASNRAAANQPNSAPTVVVVPLQVSPPVTPITVNQPLPASTAQIPAPNVPAAPVATPTPGMFTTPVVNTTNAAAPSSAVGASPAAPASSAVSPIVGASPVSNPNQSLPAAIPAGGSQECGIASCNVGSVCCNASCGICAPPGANCPQTQCG